MKAVYLAFFKLAERKTMEIGSLGDIEFSTGTYVYVGSAMSSFEKRLERHFSSVENLHWHIDYFSENAEPVDYLIIPEDSSYECRLADIVSSSGDPVEGFGCSDCSCNSHLFRI